MTAFKLMLAIGDRHIDAMGLIRGQVDEQGVLVSGKGRAGAEANGKRQGHRETNDRLSTTGNG